MIKKLLPVFFFLLNIILSAQTDEGETYYFTSPESKGYISYSKILPTKDTAKSVFLNTVVKADFDNNVLNFRLNTISDTEKLVHASMISFDGTISPSIKPVHFTGERVRIEDNEVTIWHFKGDFVEEMETDPDIQRFSFAKYNATLKLPPRTIPFFNMWAIIPQLDFDREGTFKFNALDETKLYVKMNRTVNYLGFTQQEEVNGKKMKLHKFVLQGRGQKPSYFFVTEDRKLVKVILDDKYTFMVTDKNTALKNAVDITEDK